MSLASNVYEVQRVKLFQVSENMKYGNCDNDRFDGWAVGDNAGQCVTHTLSLVAAGLFSNRQTFHI